MRYGQNYKNLLYSMTVRPYGYIGLQAATRHPNGLGPIQDDLSDAISHGEARGFIFGILHIDSAFFVIEIAIWLTQSILHSQSYSGNCNG
jgi:hypothetical protein